MFCWFCFARFLRLSLIRLDRSWAIVHPSRKQSQPPAYFAALLVNRIVGHCHISLISFWNCAGNLVCLATFGATFFWNGKTQKFWANLRKCFFWTQSGKNWSVLHFGGCGLPNFSAILRHSTAILQKPVPHVGFCVKKSIFASKKLKKHFGRKPYLNISGFLRQFCGKSKVKIHFPMVRIASFSILSAHPRSCRPFCP